MLKSQGLMDDDPLISTRTDGEDHGACRGPDRRDSSNLTVLCINGGSTAVLVDQAQTLVVGAPKIRTNGGIDREYKV